MSGVEVAGFVLAGFPILISGLEHYRDSAIVLKNWWRFEREYNNFKYEVQCQQRRFEQNLEIYLLPLIVDDDNLLRLLLSNPGGSEWKDELLEKRLKERIPENYDLYMQTIRAMNRVTEQLKQKLSVGKAGYRSEVRRLVFSFGESTRNELLSKMDRYNDRLQELLDISDRITHLRGKKATNKAHRGLMTFWTHANAVYDLLKTSWRRQCCHYHTANLLLKHRLDAEVDFNILFHVGGAIREQGAVRWIWQNTDIKLVEKEPIAVTITIPVPNTSISRSSDVSQNGSQNASETTSRGDIRSTRRNWKKSLNPFRSAMKRSPSPSPCPGSKPIANARFVDSTANPPNIPTPTDIKQRDPTQFTDLCHTLSGFCSAQKGSLLLRNDEHQYVLSPILKRLSTDDTRQTITLETLLRRTSPIILTRRDRYFIALSVASSQLQLHPTPWIGSQWTKGDIVFLCDPGNANKACIEQPYVSRNFLRNTSDNHTALTSGDFSFSTLGILLLELCFYTPFEDYPPKHSVSSVDPAFEPILDHSLAMQWCVSAADETGPEYADAVRWCLETTFSKRAQWRQELVQEVIEPLQRCYKHLAGARY